MKDGMTPSRRVLSEQERGLARRALAPVRVSETGFEVLLELSEECALTVCEGDFDSPYETIGREPASDCPGICAAVCAQTGLKGWEAW